MSSAPTPNATPSATPGYSQAPGDYLGRIVYLVRELGLTTVLVLFLCYMLAVQMPAMQTEFRAQTDKLAETVKNNSQAMTEMSREIQALRSERRAAP